MQKIMMNITCINSISDCLQMCKQFKSSSFHTSTKSGDNELSFFYRGESSLNYITQPSLFRTSKYNQEDKLIHELILEKPEEFPNYNTNMFSTLAKMQHFGMPTRLLDISKNPLVALWFACKKSIINKQQDGKFIFIAGYPNLPNSNYAKILSLFAFNAFKSSLNANDLYILRDQLIQCGVTLAYKNGEIDIKNMEQDYNYYINSDPIILPDYNTERIKTQQGAFIMFGNNSEDTNCSTKSIHSIKDIDPYGLEFFYSITSIPQSKKSYILSELNEIGINESYLFPELEHTIAQLRIKHQI